MTDIEKLKERFNQAFSKPDEACETLMPFYMSKDELWEMCEKMTFLEDDDLKLFLPVALYFCLETQPISEEEKLCLTQLCLFLEMPYGDNVSSDKKDGTLNLFSSEQRNLIVEWLSLAMTWDALKFDQDSITNAIDYWEVNSTGQP